MKTEIEDYPALTAGDIDNLEEKLSDVRAAIEKIVNRWSWTESVRNRPARQSLCMDLCGIIAGHSKQYEIIERIREETNL